MNTADMELAKAASELTVQDFQYLEQHGMIDASGNRSSSTTEQPELQQEPSTPQNPKPSRKRRRRTIKREWPDVGKILQADYHGQHYEAEVIKAPQYSSGKALKILSGPSATKVHHSFSGAMIEATRIQREQQQLGQKGMANGWAFWKTKED